MCLVYWIKQVATATVPTMLGEDVKYFRARAAKGKHHNSEEATKVKVQRAFATNSRATELQRAYRKK